jgi:hypothetical protein
MGEEGRKEGDRREGERKERKEERKGERMERDREEGKMPNLCLIIHARRRKPNCPKLTFR